MSTRRLPAWARAIGYGSNAKTDRQMRSGRNPLQKVISRPSEPKSIRRRPPESSFTGVIKPKRPTGPVRITSRNPVAIRRKMREQGIVSRPSLGSQVIRRVSSIANKIHQVVTNPRAPVVRTPLTQAVQNVARLPIVGSATGVSALVQTPTPYRPPAAAAVSPCSQFPFMSDQWLDCVIDQAISAFIQEQVLAGMDNAGIEEG